VIATSHELSVEVSSKQPDRNRRNFFVYITTTNLLTAVRSSPTSPVGSAYVQLNVAIMDLPRHNRSTLGRRSFSVAGPTVWNSLPNELWDQGCTESTFKQSL